MTLQEIKDTLAKGLPVFWKTSHYKVIKDSKGQYLIRCELNNDCIGLTHQDGVTMNGTPSDFFTFTKG